MRNVCDVVVRVLRSRSAEAPLNLEEILSHVIVLGALDRTRPHDTTEISDALRAEMTRRAETHLPQRFTTADGEWWGLVDPPPSRLRPAGRGWMAQLVRDVRWRSTNSVGSRLESFRYDASSATALLRASRQHGDTDVTLAGQIDGTLVVPRLRGGLKLPADVDGDVIIEGPIGGDVTISGQVTGSVHVRGAIDGTLHIDSSVHRCVRIAANHVGRIEVDGQIGEDLQIAARVIDGVAVSGWVADDLTISGTVAGGVRIAADISGRLAISKRVMGNVKAGGWILGDIDVSGPVDGEVAISSWVGGAVSITAPVTTVDLGSGRFHGSIKLRPESARPLRTTLTSIRLAEFHAPVRIHCDVDTTAVDTTGVVGRSQLRCVGSNRRPFDQDVGRAKVAAAHRATPRSPQPIQLQPADAAVTPPTPPQPLPITPSSAAEDALPSMPRPIQPQADDTPADLAELSGALDRPQQKLRAADTQLTLAELAQQETIEPPVEVRHTLTERARQETFEPAVETPPPPNEAPAAEPSTTATVAAPRFTQPIPFEPIPFEPIPFEPIAVQPLAFQLDRAQTGGTTETAVVERPRHTQPVPTLPVQQATAPTETKQPAETSQPTETEHPNETEQLVLGIAWLS